MCPGASDCDPGGVAAYDRLMCLAIPMQVRTIDGLSAECEIKGIRRTVSLFMLQGEPLEVGDFVLVHVGYAIQKLAEGDARSTWELYDEMLAADA
jgi:hydrogenase expression/formation protein HypC